MQRHLEKELKSLTSEIASHASVSLENNKFQSSNLPGADNEATILVQPLIKAVTFDLKKREYHGGGTLLLPFTGKTEALLSFTMHRSDYFALDNNKASKMYISNINDHYLDVEMEDMIKFKGFAEISIDNFIESKSGKKVREMYDLIDGVEIEDVEILS